MEIKMETQAFTFQELDAIRSALFVAMKTELLVDAEPMKEALYKIDYVIDKYCKPPHYNGFALLPLLAESDEE